MCLLSQVLHYSNERLTNARHKLERLEDISKLWCLSGQSRYHPTIGPSMLHLQVVYISVGSPVGLAEAEVKILRLIFRCLASYLDPR